MDREKIIGLLQEMKEYFRECRKNASFASKAENHFWELQNAANEAVELLKEQEAVEPNPVHNSFRWFACGKCDCSITREDRFCPRCGKAVKWG